MRSLFKDKTKVKVFEDNNQKWLTINKRSHLLIGKDCFVPIKPLFKIFYQNGFSIGQCKLMLKGN